MVGMEPTPERVIARLLANVAVEPNGCHVSLYSRGSHGYPQIGWHEKGRTITRLAHRVAWEAAHGPIPVEMTLDHICRNKPCINPQHLRLLTNSENGRRNWRDFPLGQICVRGHKGERVNYRGRNRCPECWKIYQHTYAAKKKR